MSQQPWEDWVDAQRGAQYQEEYAKYIQGQLDKEELVNYEKYLAEYEIGENETVKHPEKVAHDLLHCPMGSNDAGAATIGEYLGLLLSTLWLEDEGFSGKRPFGNSGWQWDVYTAMVKNGFAVGTVYNEDGYEELEDFPYEAEKAADELIIQAIRLMYDHG